jgi:hypothetical protein
VAEELIELGRSSRKWFPKGVNVPGWSKAKTAGQRHSALKKLVKRTACKRVLSDMQAISNVTRDKETQKKMRADRRWLKKQGACKL